MFPFLHWFSGMGLGLLPLLGIGFWGNVLATIVSVDLTTFLFHRHFHRNPLLWRIHMVHHMDSQMDVTTGFRFHVAEHALFLPVRFAVMVVLGSTWISAAAAGVFLLVLIYFQHCNFRLPIGVERMTRLVFTTPDMHRVHHSALSQETNSNYGIIFSFWDRWLGSYREIDDQDSIKIGLPDFPDPGNLTLLELLGLPWRLRPGRPGQPPSAPGSGRGNRVLA
ncbi:MAG: sterol desaturase family protein [Elusimicrobia bacterium]|nr:sterol desaturase family protein [Elusimicrobiota bacterium]